MVEPRFDTYKGMISLCLDQFHWLASMWNSKLTDVEAISGYVVPFVDVVSATFVTNDLIQVRFVCEPSPVITRLWCGKNTVYLMSWN